MRSVMAHTDYTTQSHIPSNTGWYCLAHFWESWQEEDHVTGMQGCIVISL